MLVLGMIFSFFGLGALLCLLFTLAIYALPFFVAVTAGMAAFYSGAGVIGAILLAAFARLAMMAPPVLGQGFSVSPATPRLSQGTKGR